MTAVAPPLDGRAGNRALAIAPRQAALAALLVAVAAVPPLLGSYESFVCARIAVVALIGLSVTVVTGYAGQLSLMPYTFVGIGLFTAGHAMSSWGWPLWLAMALAALATVPVALLVGLVSVRLRGFYFAIATLTFASAMGATLFASDAFTGGQGGLSVPRPAFAGVDFAADRPFYLLCLATALGATWLVLGLQHSRVGRAMYAVRENEIAAQAIGINAMKTKLTAIVVSGLLAGVGGVYQGMLLEAPTPTPFTTPHVESAGVLLVIVVVVGGVRSAWGPFIGATVVFLQSEALRQALFFQYFYAAFAALVFLYILLQAPGGLVQIARHEAALIRANARKHAPRVALVVGAQVMFFYAAARWGS